MVKQAIRYARQYSAPSICADVSITALPFFQRMGFKTVKENDVVLDGITMKNYTMLYMLP